MFNTLMNLKMLNLMDGMLFLKKLLTLMPPNQKTGMMNLMVIGKPLKSLTQNSRDHGDQNKSKILNTKENGFIL